MIKIQSTKYICTVMHREKIFINIYTNFTFYMNIYRNNVRHAIIVNARTRIRSVFQIKVNVRC